MHNLVVAWNWLQGNEIAFSVVAVIFLLFAGFMSSMICKFFLLNIVRRFILHTKKSDPHNKDMRIARGLANLVPVVTVYVLSQIIIGLPAGLVEAIRTICGVLFIINLTMMIIEMLDLINIIYIKKHGEKQHSIKGFIQIAKIVISSIATILVIATLSNRSPVIIFSSMGAAAAVLMLVFQHTLISLVANIQVSSSNVIKQGDWIEMPQNNISGEVTDIALHTITVRNWDNTMSWVPTKNFITESYTNWQPMFESGGRRIKRSFFVDQSSIVFATMEQLNALEKMSAEKYAMLETWLKTRVKEINAQELGENGVTNLELFRKHVLNYLRRRTDIRNDMYLVVRQLSPTSEGLPIEIYCFTSNVFWTEYEDTQSEIFEYVLAIARYFSLEIYQQPSGIDMKNMIIRHNKNRTP